MRQQPVEISTIESNQSQSQIIYTRPVSKNQFASWLEASLLPAEAFQGASGWCGAWRMVEVRAPSFIKFNYSRCHSWVLTCPSPRPSRVLCFRRLVAAGCLLPAGQFELNFWQRSKLTQINASKVCRFCSRRQTWRREVYGAKCAY